MGPRELTTSQNSHGSKVSSVILCNNEPFLHWIVMCKKKKSGLYTTTGNDQLSSWTKKKPISSSQSQICIKKTSQSLFGGLPPVWFTTAFWIPGKPLHLRRTFSKSMRCTKNYKPAAGIDQQKGPALLHDDAWPHVAQTTLQSWKNWAMKFCFICHIHLTSC